MAQPTPEPALTESDLDVIEARVEAATEGPWEAKPAESAVPHERLHVWTANGICVAIIWGYYPAGPNADFIAAARTDVVALVAAVRRLRRAVEVAVAEMPDSSDRRDLIRALEGEEND